MMTIFQGDIAIVLLLLTIFQVSEEKEPRILSVKRQDDGDLVTFANKTDCSSFDAHCYRKNFRQTAPRACEKCKCSEAHATYFSNVRQCMNIRDIPNEVCPTRNAQLFPQVFMLSKFGEAFSMKAYHCKKQRNYRYPSLYSVSSDNDTKSSWFGTKLKGIHFSLVKKFQKNNRPKDWRVKFKDRSEIYTTYAGKIIQLQFRCKFRRNKRKYSDICLIFKIANTESFELKTSTTPTQTLSTPNQNITFTRSTESNFTPTKPTSASGNITANVNSNKNIDRKNITSIFLIIIIVASAVIVLFTAVIVFVCYKRRTTASNRSNNRNRKENVENEYDIPIISTLTNVNGGENGRVSQTSRQPESVIDGSYVEPINYSPHSSDVYDQLNFDDMRKDSNNHYQALILN